MKTNCLTFVAVVVLGVTTIRAQMAPNPSDQSTAAAPAPSPGPPLPAQTTSPYEGGYGYNSWYHPGTALVGSVTLPYAFNWDAAGISAELGGALMGSHFFGGEISYYGSSRKHYNVFDNNGVFIGHFNSSQEVTTVDFAYRYFAPIGGYGPRPPVAFYVGGSGGVAFVNYSNDGSAFGFHNDGGGNLTGEFVAGFQFAAGPGTAFRLGYRYVTVNDAWRFDRRVDLNSSVLEAGVDLRF